MTQILWGHCFFPNFSRRTRSAVLGGRALNMRASPPVAAITTAKWQLKWQNSQCHNATASVSPLCTYIHTHTYTHPQSYVKIAGRQSNRTGGGCGDRGENLRKMGEAWPENLSESRQPCQQQQGRTPDANYADKWCWQLVHLGTIYSLGDPNYRHLWRTNRQCAERRGESWLPRSKTKVIWCLLTLAACIISVSWQPNS